MRRVRGYQSTLKGDLVIVGRAILREEGIDALTLRAVARRARVSAMAPYRHFADKQALLAAIAIEGYERIRALCVKAARKSTPEEKVQSACRDYFDFAVSDPAMYRLLFSHYIDQVSDHEELLAVTDATNAALRRLMRQLPGVKDANLAALALWSLLHGFASLYLDQQITPDLEPRATAEAAHGLLEAIVRQWASGTLLR